MRITDKEFADIEKEIAQLREQLAAEREKLEAFKSIYDETARQLTAEREGYAMALQMVHIEGKRANDAEAQLAAERERADKAAVRAELAQIELAQTQDLNVLLMQERDKLQEQLTAEREQGVKALAERSFELHAALEALRQIATIEANDPDEVAAGLKQTQSYEIATATLVKI